MAGLLGFPWVWEGIFRKSRVSDLGLGAAGLLRQRAFWGVFGARFEGFVRALFGLLLGVILGFKITCLSCLDVYFGLCYCVVTRCWSDSRQVVLKVVGLRG